MLVPAQLQASNQADHGPNCRIWLPLCLPSLVTSPRHRRTGHQTTVFPLALVESLYRCTHQPHPRPTRPRSHHTSLFVAVASHPFLLTPRCARGLLCCANSQVLRDSHARHCIMPSMGAPNMQWRAPAHLHLFSSTYPLHPLPPA